MKLEPEVVEMLKNWKWWVCLPFLGGIWIIWKIREFATWIVDDLATPIQHKCFDWIEGRNEEIR